MCAGYRWRSRPDQVGEPSAGANDHAWGVDLRGGQTWSRNLNAEASVSADPARTAFRPRVSGESRTREFGGEHQENLRIHRSAMFTDSGELVTVDPDGSGLAPRELKMI